MKKILAFLAAIVLGATTTVYAQQTTGQKVADVASYATLGFNIALDVHRSWTAPDRGHRMLMLGVRTFTTGVLVTVLKDAFPRARPCAPTCGIDSAYSDFPSGHTAFAFSTLGHPTEEQGDYLVKLGSGILTGILRGEANKHDLLGVVSGAAIGFGTSRLR